MRTDEAETAHTTDLHVSIETHSERYTYGLDLTDQAASEVKGQK